MEFILGFIAGITVTLGVSACLFIEWTKEIEKLKDFDTWKEWKNK